MKLIKDYRLMGIIVLVLIALALFLYYNFTRTTGVVVTYVDPNTPCKDIINIGSVITDISNVPIMNSNDFKRATTDLEGITTFIINNNPRSCNIPKNSTLSVIVEDVKKVGLSLSVDIVGGQSYLFKTENASQTVLQQTIDSIKSRMKQYDLANTRVDISDNNIQIIAGSDEENYVKFLTEHGVLEGGLVLKINTNENKSEFVFNDKDYKIALKGNKSVILNGSEYKVGGNFILDDVNIKVDSINRSTTTFFVKIFDERDLILIKDSTGTVADKWTRCRKREE
ncbi:MAG: hypothetical protein NTW30_01815 [Candidatus Aenigmarchaeota archaeon]|nr:hypothetical protein [Candidatus Aenigmarchaeota archaeon]